MNTSTTSPENQIVLDLSKKWFKTKIIDAHLFRTKKLKSISEFDINPFITPYLSYFLTGSISEDGIAKSLVYARSLGSSISTSFGTNIQNFIAEVLVNAYGSVVEGVDIVFTDKSDGRLKYTQIKLGPNTINADDVTTIDNHFRGIRNRSRTNNANIQLSDLVIGVLYGSEDDLNANYKRLRDEKHYPVFVGNEFWKRLTGDDDFMEKLIQSFTAVVIDTNPSSILDEIISTLSSTTEINQIVKTVRNV